MSVHYKKFYVVMVLGMILMFVSACTPPSLEVFLSPNPSFDQADTQSAPLQQEPAPMYQPVSPLSPMVVQAVAVGPAGDTLVFQLTEALTEAEAYVRSGEARLREQNLLEAMREFERARLLIEQDVDPTLHYIEQQSTIQGGNRLLSVSRLQQIAQQRTEMLSRINRAYDFRTIQVQQRESEKLDLLRKESKPVLQPVSLPQATYAQGASRVLIAPRPQFPPAPISPAINLSWLSGDMIDRAISRFKQRYTDFRDCLVRANQYFPQVTAILSTEGVPAELAYIALIESGYQPSAKSSSGDAGLWQLSRSIARSYGLNVDSYTDERMHIAPSTRVFARYINDLYSRFGSWELAVLGYEMGEQGLQNAINRSGSYDLRIIEQNLGSYSPGVAFLTKLAASMTIARNPMAYGFDVDLPNISGQLTARVIGQQSTMTSPKMLLEPPAATLY